MHNEAALMNGHTEAHLQQIAWYLGVPVSDFFGDDTDPSISPAADQSAREMLDLWIRIRDPRDRLRCLNLMRSCAARIDQPLDLVPTQF
jgi:hypothetical protein